MLQRVERDRQAAATEAKRRNLMRKELARLRRGHPTRPLKPKFRIEAANQLLANIRSLRNTVELAKLAWEKTPSTCSTWSGESPLVSAPASSAPTAPENPHRWA